MYPPRELYDRIKGIENNCKLARGKDNNLRTQGKLGYMDLELHIQTKGERSWKRVDLTKFGRIPELDLKDVTVSPLMGRPKLLRNRSESESPNNVRKRINMDDPFGEELVVDVDMFEKMTEDKGKEK